MAELNIDFYKGADGYSDGDQTEDELLSLARSGVTLDDLKGAANFSIYYHMSEIRENICNWYPFEEGCSVLEIGAGCGAITGCLCRKAGKVTSVELSKRRATVNYERNKSFDNLTIYVGNLNDIVLQERFDYVVMIGVLEYAGLFTQGDSPYTQFLSRIRGYLKPEGKLLLAIENRLGIKYFAGAPEDHLNLPFLGLQNYPDNSGVRTFSHSELEAVLQDSGFSYSSFYYPYPDYKFPTEIYSDETIENGQYGKKYNFFNRDRVSVFPEVGIAKLLAKEGIAKNFSNSFFVVSSQQELDQKNKPVYVKLNQDRYPKFRIKTTISSGDDGYYVEKTALCREASDHIRKISENEATLSEFYAVLKGERKADSMVYPYDTRQTLDAKMDRWIHDRDLNSVLNAFDKLFSMTLGCANEQTYATEAFRKWFGDMQAEEKMLCAAPANIDIIPGNVFCSEDEYCMSDCEWVADFPVPVKYIQWRTLETVYREHPTLENLYPKIAMLTNLQITMHEIAVFQEWESHFVNIYVAPIYNTAYRKKELLVNPTDWQEFAENCDPQKAKTLLNRKIDELRDVCWQINGISDQRNAVLTQKIDEVGAVCRQINGISDQRNAELMARLNEQKAQQDSLMLLVNQLLEMEEARNASLPVKIWRFVKNRTNMKVKFQSWYLKPEEHSFQIGLVNGFTKLLSKLYPRGGERMKVAIQNALDNARQMTALPEGNDDIPVYTDIYGAAPKEKIRENIRKVSVVIPNYNYEKYIVERIDSVLLQSYPVYELIVLDDCSTDNSCAVIQEKLKTIQGIKTRFIPNEKNSGSVFAQWQKAFREASGDFVWIAEADDSCSPRFLETIMQAFDDPDVCMSYCESLTMDEENRILMNDLRPWIDVFSCGKWNEDYIADRLAENTSTLCINNTIANVSSVVFRKGDYDRIIEEAKQYHLAGDWYVYMRILENGKLAYYRDSLNYHRMHSHGVTLSTKHEQEYDEICKLQDYAMAHYPITEEVQKKIYERREEVRGRFGLQ